MITIKLTWLINKYFLLILTLCIMQSSFFRESFKVGAEQLVRYLPLIQGENVALLVNKTATVGDQHLVDLL